MSSPPVLPKLLRGDQALEHAMRRLVRVKLLEVEASAPPPDAMARVRTALSELEAELAALFSSTPAPPTP